MLSIEIGFIGLIAGIGRHAILLGREGMHDACFKSCFGESPFGSQMIVSSSFHNDDRVLNVVLLLRFANPRHGQLEEDGLMLKCLAFDEQISKVVGHHPLRPMLGRIDANDGESGAADLRDPGSNDPTWLLQILSLARIGL